MAYKDLTFLLFAKDMNVGQAFGKVSAEADSMALGVKGSLAGLGIAAAGAAIAIGAHSVKMAGDFQAATTRIITDGGGAGESVSQLESVISAAGVKTGTSMTDAAAAMYKLSSAGFTLKEGGGAALLATLQGAKIGGADAVVVADALSTTMTDFGYKGADAAKVMSMLTATVATGKTNLNDLASSLHSVLPNAQAAGLGLQEVLAAIGTMTAEGVSADQATQNLNHSILQLQAPSLVAQHAMAGVGLSALNIAQNLGKRGLAGTYDVLLAAMAHSSHAGMIVVKAFGDSAQASAAMRTELANMPAPLRAAAVQLENGALTSKQWSAELKRYPLTISNLGKAFAVNVKHATGFSDALKSGEGTTRTAAKQLEAMVGGTDALSTAMHLTGEHMGAFVKNTKSITAATTEADGAVRGWSETQKTHNQKMAEFSAWISQVQIKIGNALIPAVDQFTTNLMYGAKQWGDAFKWLGDTTSQRINFIKGAFSSAGTWLVDAGRWVVQGLAAGITGATHFITDAIGTITNLIPNTVRNLLQIHSPSKVMHQLGTYVGQGLTGGILGTANQVQSATNTLSNMVIGMFEQKKGGISSWAESSALRTIQSGTNALIAEATKRAAIGKQIAAAEKQLTKDLASQKKASDASVKNTVFQDGDITKFASAGDAVGGLQALVTKTRRFGSDLKQLSRMGIDSNTLQELVTAGVSGGGLTMADQLIGNPIDFREIVALQGQLSSAAGSLASAAGQAEWGPKVAQDRARVATLQGAQRVETWRMQKTATGMLNAIAKETHVHIHLTGHYAGTKDDLAKTVTQAIRDAVKRGQLPKNVLTAL